MELVGKSVPRAGGGERVTGATRYVTDILLPGLLHAKLVRSGCAHATIIEIEASQARQVPGVHAVLTARDLPQPVPKFGPLLDDRPVLADGEVLFFGEPVAIVLGEDEDAAEEAARLVEVKVEEQPGAYTLEAAMAPGAPLVRAPSLRPDSRFRDTNISEEWSYRWGEPDQQRPHLVVEDIYTFPMVGHYAIEPHTFLVAPSGEDLTVWSPIQHPFLLRTVMARVLGRPLASIRVVAMDIGGGFGGKGYPKYEPLLALAALHTGRPVRLALSLPETFQTARRAGARMRMRSGFDRQGRLVSNHVQGDYQIGAYVDISHRVVSKAGYLGNGPYACPHTDVLVRAILTHTAPSTAFRGFGAPQMVWAMERQMDEAARRLGIDRVEIRRRNLPDKGGTLVPGDTPVDGDWGEGLQKAAELIGWGEPVRARAGRGIAIGIKSPAPATTSQAIVRLHTDGSLTVFAGTTDLGQGSRTVFAQMAAEALGMPLEQVRVVLGDTGVAPYDSLTASSRSTVYMGNAILKACAHIRDQLIEIAGEMLRCPPADIVFEVGMLGLADRAVTIPEVLKARFGAQGGEIIGVGAFTTEHDPNHPLGGKAAFWEVVFVGAEVEVDEETGQYRIGRLAVVSDVGKALNPAQAHGQDEGGAMMAIGHTVMERLVYDERGRLVNGSALDYRIPTIQDLPDVMETALVENADGPGPYGAKGVGESGTLAVAPAVASAIQEAVGVSMRDLPLTPECVWEAIQERES